MGLIIESSELAGQEATRFDAMTRPENVYSVALRPGSKRPGSRLVWRTQESGQPVEYDTEPARNWWQKAKAKFLSWLPLDSEL
jgi:putative cardiolipin synthase